jgi:hypothetical protein
MRPTTDSCSRFVVATIVVLVGGSVAGAADPPAGASLSVAVDTPSIYAGDPLLLKCILSNDGKQAVSFRGGFSSRSAGVQIEVLPPGAKEFRRTEAIGEGTVFAVKRKWDLPAGQKVVCYSQLVGGFSVAGKWQIRIKATVDDKEVTSPPVSISVAERPEKARRAFEDFKSEIRSCVWMGEYVKPDELEKALEAREVLGGSRAAQAVTEAQVLRALRMAGSARARVLALEDVGKHRDKLGTVDREYFDLRTADVLIHLKDYEKAKALVEGIKDPSDMQIDLLTRILAETQQRKQK